ncbi:MAG: transposase, partial [Caldimonas sp.]
MTAIAAGVSTRRYAGTLDDLPPPQAALCTSKSAVSRPFVALSQDQLDEWLHRPLDALDLPVVMIDGIHFRDRAMLVVLRIDAQGNKHVLGLREGSTEATRMVRSLLADLIDRGLHPERMRLWVIDGGKALRKAIVECFGATALVQRRQEHKRRNDVMLKSGAIYRNLPVHAVAFRSDPEPVWTPKDAQAWDCYGETF